MFSHIISSLLPSSPRSVLCAGGRRLCEGAGRGAGYGHPLSRAGCSYSPGDAARSEHDSFTLGNLHTAVLKRKNYSKTLFRIHQPLFLIFCVSVNRNGLCSKSTWCLVACTGLLKASSLRALPARTSVRRARVSGVFSQWCCGTNRAVLAGSGGPHWSSTQGSCPPGPGSSQFAASAVS